MTDDVSVPFIDERRPYKHFMAFTALSYAKTQQDRDFIFTINGPRGFGKSTFGAVWAKSYFENNLGMSFTKKRLQQSLVRPGNLQQEILDDDHEFWPIVLDEAILSAYVGDYAKNDVKDLIKLFTICRDKHRPMCLISPSVDDITTRLRNFAVYRLSVKARGVAVLFTKDLSEAASKDPFHLDELQKYEGLHDESTPVEDVIKRLRRHPCFKDVIEFPRLPKEVQEWYDAQRELIAYGDKTRVKDDELAANIFVNLQDNFNKLQSMKMLTLDFFYKELCRDAVHKKHMVGINGFHRAIKTIRTNILTQGATIQKTQNEENTD